MAAKDSAELIEILRSERSKSKKLLERDMSFSSTFHWNFGIPHEPKRLNAFLNKLTLTGRDFQLFWALSPGSGSKERASWLQESVCWIGVTTNF